MRGFTAGPWGICHDRTVPSREAETMRESVGAETALTYLSVVIWRKQTSEEWPERVFESLNCGAAINKDEMSKRWLLVICTRWTIRHQKIDRPIPNRANRTKFQGMESNKYLLCISTEQLLLTSIIILLPITSCLEPQFQIRPDAIYIRLCSSNHFLLLSRFFKSFIYRLDILKALQQGTGTIDVQVIVPTRRTLLQIDFPKWTSPRFVSLGAELACNNALCGCRGYLCNNWVVGDSGVRNLRRR